MDEKKFRKVVYSYFRKHARVFPWRRTSDPYLILVSEIMLQQTQADRVMPKFEAFIKKFPTVQTLAKARLRDVLIEWQGLGYNRRAMYLHKTAKELVTKYNGVIPCSLEELESLPGIGPYTARAISVFAWNIPQVFIETNIRTVFIYHFFSNREKVSDVELMPLIEKTLDVKNPRKWYSALMDYGAMLKRTVPNPSRKSRSYVRQGTFKGSLREVRGAILRLLSKKLFLTEAELAYNCNNFDTQLFSRAVQGLLTEKLIEKKGARIRLRD